METFESKRSGRSPDPCVIELREMLQSVLGENFVRLYHYGSRVTGSAASDSDYDVLCITRQPIGRRESNEVLERTIDVELAHDVLFDLHFYSEGELRTPPFSFTPYVRHVLADGIVV